MVSEQAPVIILKYQWKGASKNDEIHDKHFYRVFHDFFGKNYLKWLIEYKFYIKLTLSFKGLSTNYKKTENNFFFRTLFFIIVIHTGRFSVFVGIKICNF